MNCPHCNSTKTTNLKINIVNPTGEKRSKCLECYNTFTYNPTNKIIISPTLTSTLTPTSSETIN